MIVILAVVEDFSMPSTISYPCVTTEKQIYLNGNGLYQQQQQQQQHLNETSGEVLVNGFGVATTNITHDGCCDERQKENFKSIMIIDVLNRLCPQLSNGKTDGTHSVPPCMTNMTTTTTKTTTIKVSSPNATLSTLTTSNVKRLNSYFMQQAPIVQPNITTVDKEMLKFKNFKDINNKLYSLRQFYESHQQQQNGEVSETGKHVVLNKKTSESKTAIAVAPTPGINDSLILSSSETQNSSTNKPSSKCNVIKVDTLESFEKKVVNDLDSILSSISMNDYNKAPGDDKFHSSSTSDSSSSSSSDSDNSCSNSENGDYNRIDNEFEGVESRFRFELECNNEDTGDGAKEEFDATIERQEQSEVILNLVLHRLPGENLGIELRVEQDGILKVTHVLPNSAAECASDCHGNSCPIRENDEIIEINGVSLINLTKDEILSIVKELPLYLTVTIRRRDNGGSPLPIGIKSNDHDFSGHVSPNTADIQIPMGFSLHTVYLSSLESKCIMPDDIRECCEIEGLFKMQRSTLQISEEDHLQKGDIIYNINGEHYKNKFDIISKLGSLSGIAEISVLRKSNTNGCYGSTCDEIPYCNSIFAQNSIKLAMRRYEKPGLKSSSDADVAYTISERASAEPPENETFENTDHQHHACTQTSIISDGTVVHAKFYETCPKLSEIEVQKANDSIVENKVKPKQKAKSEPTGSSIMDDNWIICGKRFNMVESTTPEKFQRTSSIFLNNDFSNNDQTDVPRTVPGMHVTTMDIYPNNPDNADSNYYFTEDATLRTLTNSSCHSDRSLVQLNLVCCEIDQSKDDIGRDSSRISEEEEENYNDGSSAIKASASANVTNDIMSPDSLHQPHYYKCSLNQDSVALKSYSHLPSSSSCSSSNQEFKSNDSLKNFINSCKIELSSSKKELNFSLAEKDEEENGHKSEKRLQQEELSKILQNMINDIEEHSRAPSRNEESIKIDENFRKSKTADLIEKLNAGAIGTVIYENRVDTKPKEINLEKKEEEKAKKTLVIETMDKLSSKSDSSLTSPHQMKNQVQLELLQLVNGATKGKKSKLASMIKRIQDHEGQNNEQESKEEEEKAEERKSTPLPPPPPPPPMPLLNENKKSIESPLNLTQDSLQQSFQVINSSAASEKFSALICPQPFHLQKGPNQLKKTFSLQQPFNCSQNSVFSNRIKTSAKELSTSNSTFGVKHSISFCAKSETNAKGDVESTIDYVDSAFEKEIKQKIQHVPTPNIEPPVNSSQVEIQVETQTEPKPIETPSSKVSSVKEKILLFTKNKRPSFHSKRQQSQFVIDNLNNPVISRKPSYTKTTNGSPFKTTHAASNQPTQLILPDLGGLNIEPKSTPKHKRISPKTSLKEPVKPQPSAAAKTETPKSPKTEFKSVKDKVAYFSSRVNDTETSTPNLHTLAKPTSTSKISTIQKPKKETPNIKSTTSTISTSTSNISKNSSLNKGVVVNSTNNIKNASTSSNIKLEVKNILCSNSNENKILDLIHRFTKRK